MHRYKRILTIDDMKSDMDGFDGVILGHENCPVFYRQQPIDEMIGLAQENGLDIQVNIPVIFEEYLQEFKEESVRLLEQYPDIKLILNDWGMLSYLHGLYPEKKFSVGKGVSFTYGDNPWNEHILEAEKPELHQALFATNMENEDTIEQLRALGVDEIEMSDLSNSEHAYRHLHDEGFIVTVDQGLSVATMSRACHLLRFLDKVDEKGSCIRYCNQPIVLSIRRYYNMMENRHDEISPETKAIQPDMICSANITMVRNEGKTAGDTSFIDRMVTDRRISAQ